MNIPYAKTESGKFCHEIQSKALSKMAKEREMWQTRKDSDVMGVEMMVQVTKSKAMDRMPTIRNKGELLNNLHKGCIHIGAASLLCGVGGRGKEF